jgi:hypothetical protein
MTRPLVRFHVTIGLKSSTKPPNQRELQRICNQVYMWGVHVKPSKGMENIY